MIHDTNELKKVLILNEQKTVTSKQAVTLMYDDGIKTVTNLNIQTPVLFDNLVTYQIQETAESKQYNIPPIQTIRDAAIALKRYIKSIISRLNGPYKLDGLIIDARYTTPNNVAHLIMEIIPYYIHAKKYANSDVKLLVNQVQKPFLPIFDLFKIQPIIREGEVTGTAIKVRATRAFQSYDIFEMTKWFPTINLLPNVYASFDFKFDGKLHKKIFISRRGARSLKNAEDVELLLTANGYHTIFMTDYPIEAQLAIGAHAEDIVAIHGASMGLLAANTKINSLIEIFPPSTYTDYFSIGLSGKVEKYVQIIPYFDKNVPFNNWQKIFEIKNKAFDIDLSQLEAALRLIEN